jgi:hypothetical protein
LFSTKTCQEKFEGAVELQPEDKKSGKWRKLGQVEHRSRTFKRNFNFLHQKVLSSLNQAKLRHEKNFEPRKLINNAFEPARDIANPA